MIEEIVLAIVQGLTEFLPVSSSAHLILVPKLLGWPDQGLAFDITVHVGSLLAVLVYYARSILTLAIGFFKGQAEEKRLCYALIIASIPVVIAGLFLHDIVDQAFRQPLLISFTTIAFGLLLGWVHWKKPRHRLLSDLRLRDAIYIGLAQALALIPGTSRSGITMTMAAWLGFTWQQAAKFSFLLSTIVIAGAGFKACLHTPADLVIQGSSLATGLLVSFLVSFSVIHAMMRLIDKVGVYPFVIYRVALGLFLGITYIMN